MATQRSLNVSPSNMPSLSMSQSIPFAMDSPRKQGIHELSTLLSSPNHTQQCKPQPQSILTSAPVSSVRRQNGKTKCSEG